METQKTNTCKISEKDKSADGWMIRNSEVISLYHFCLHEAVLSSVLSIQNGPRIHKALRSKVCVYGVYYSPENLHTSAGLTYEYYESVGR